MNTLWIRTLTATALLALGMTAQASNDELRSVLFAEADQARALANEANAALLAPRGFERATKSYQSAEKKLERGLRVDRIRGDLEAATIEFRKAAKTATLARTTFGNMIKGRTDALAAQANRLAADQWERAESEFRRAAIELEIGDLKDARERAVNSEGYFRDAELLAIKSSMLSDTRRLLEQADDQRVGRYAPDTLAKAKSLLVRAERELDENRYDADLPRSLVREARYEARHAIHLARYLREARDRDRSNETLVLEWEQPIHEIAAAADLVAELDEGYARPTAQIIEYIQDLQIRNQSLEQDVLERDQRIAAMGEEIVQLGAEMAELDQRLGGVREERMALAQQLASQERVREQVKQVESMFARSEALVFRDGNDIYLRLVGLNFEVGKSDISVDNHPLLGKVEDALRVFTEASLVVEGHTDSHGSDETNMSLSQARAESVRAYLLGTTHMDPALITAVGYGETQPVANNETREGRQRNRRIDIRIRPSADIR